MTLWSGGGRGLKLNVTMTLWFPQIVWTSPLIQGAFGHTHVPLVMQGKWIDSLDLLLVLEMAFDLLQLILALVD